MANSAFTHDPQITVPGSSTDNAVVILKNKRQFKQLNKLKHRLNNRLKHL